LPFTVSEDRNDTLSFSGDEDGTVVALAGNEDRSSVSLENARGLEHRILAVHATLAALWRVRTHFSLTLRPPPAAVSADPFGRWTLIKGKQVSGVCGYPRRRRLRTGCMDGQLAPQAWAPAELRSGCIQLDDGPSRAGSFQNW
jgi:hypothetical protein